MQEQVSCKLIAGSRASVAGRVSAFVSTGLSSEEQRLLRRQGIHLTKQDKNIFANRLSNLTRKTLSQTHWRDEVHAYKGVLKGTA